MKMNIKDYILESVRSGKKRVMPFPEDSSDADTIVYWLISNNFDEIPYKQGNESTELERHYDTTGNRCFMRGLFKEPGSRWILFYDGDELFFVRCHHRADNEIGLSGNAVTGGEHIGHIGHRGSTDFITFDELSRRASEKQLKWK